MVVDAMFGTTEAAMMENGTRTKLTVSGSTSGPMVVSTTDSGVIIICTAAVSTHGKMVESMKEST